MNKGKEHLLKQFYIFNYFTRFFLPDAEPTATCFLFLISEMFQEKASVLYPGNVCTETATQIGKIQASFKLQITEINTKHKKNKYKTKLGST